MGKRRGRPSKSGARTKGGRLSRAGHVSTFDKGTEWVQAMRDRYGEHYSTAIGRAYASGLLGEGNEAKDRYDAARKFASLYGAVIGRDRYRCPLDQTPRGGDERETTDQDIANQAWLLVNMDRIDATGCRPFFDQLTSRQFTNYGPAWLEELLNAKKHDRRDRMILDAALRAIDAIKPVSDAQVFNLERERHDRAA